MQKIVLLLVVFGLLCNLGGCSGMSRAEQLGKEEVAEQAMLDEVIQEIVTALDGQDKDALKALFSPYALEHATELDAGVEDALQFYQGTSTKVDGGFYSASKTYDYGKTAHIVTGHYTVETAANSYTIHFVYQMQSDADPDRIGLCTMQIITEDIRTDDFYWVNEDNAPGVYVQCSG